MDGDSRFDQAKTKVPIVYSLLCLVLSEIAARTPFNIGLSI